MTSTSTAKKSQWQTYMDRKVLNRNCNTEAIIGLSWIDIGDNGLPRSIIHEILDYSGDFSLDERELIRRNNSICKVKISLKYEYQTGKILNQIHSFLYCKVCDKFMTSGTKISFNHTSAKYHDKNRLKCNDDFMYNIPTESYLREKIMSNREMTFINNRPYQIVKIIPYRFPEGNV